MSFNPDGFDYRFMTEEIKTKGHEKLLDELFKELDCLPGEKIKFENQILGRLAPLVTPMMHKVGIRTRSFFAPVS